MKNFRRSMRRFIPSIIFSIIFALLFPFSLMAQETEYKVPEHSMSYLTLAPAPVNSEPSVKSSEAAAALTISDRQELEPDFQPQMTSQNKIQVIPEPAANLTKSNETAKSIKKNEAIKVKSAPEKKGNKTKAEAKLSIPGYEIAPPIATEEPVLRDVSEEKYETPAFSEALSRMQQNKAHREAEAARLGIVLPSQGGDMAAVSPSLSKIQQTLKAITAR